MSDPYRYSNQAPQYSTPQYGDDPSPRSSGQQWPQQGQYGPPATQQPYMGQGYPPQSQYNPSQDALYPPPPRSRSNSGNYGSRGPSDGKKDHSRERGLGASLVGAAGGGFLGHEVGGGALGTIGGMIAGAVSANMAEKEWEKHER
ncbi:hypothetical protein MMC12_000346 [Toensbergia leucococca]|nr:hypothetical protein [Toensbergia leucococca]